MSPLGGYITLIYSIDFEREARLFAPPNFFGLPRVSVIVLSGFYFGSPEGAFSDEIGFLLIVVL